MNILDKYKLAAKNSTSQVGKSVSNSLNTYVKSLYTAGNKGSLIGKAQAGVISFFRSPALAAKDSNYNLPNTPTKYVDTIK